MRSAFAKDVVRSIRGSLGRFLAIMGIVALGCGFYAGLQMCGPDMRSDADALYDGTQLWDLRLISTLGFEDEDVQRVREVEGVLQVMPSLTCDAMAHLGSEQVAVRVTSLDPVRAKASADAGPYAVTSAEEGYLNRPRLVSGRWPEAKGECVISADVPREDCGIGDTVELLYGASDLDDLLAVTNFEVVGTVSSSNYPYTGSFGSTTLGSGMIDQYLYVAPASLAEDAPYTEIYLLVDGAKAELSESDAYQEVVGRTKARLEGLERELSSERQADLKARATEELDDKWDEYDREKAKAERELADAKAELDDGAEQIESGERELAQGEQDLRDGEDEYARAKKKAEDELARGQEKIDEGQRTIDEQRAKLAEGRDQLNEGRAAYEEGLSELLAQTGASSLDEAQKKLRESADQVDEGIEKLEQGIEQIEQAPGLAEEGIRQATEGIEQAQSGIEQADAAAAQAQEGIEQAEAAAAQAQEGIEQAEAAAAEAQAGIDAIDEGLANIPSDEELSQQQEALEQAIAAAPEDQRPALEQQLDQVRAARATRADLEGKRAKAQAGLERAQKGKAEAEAGLAQAQEGKRQAEEGLAQAQAGRKQAEEGLAQAQAGLAQAQEGLTQAREAQLQLPELRAQLADLRKTRADIDKALAGVNDLVLAGESLATSQKQLDEGEQKLQDGQDELDRAREELKKARRTARDELAKAEEQLEDARRELEEGRAELADARATYEDGLAEWLDARAEADETFADALAQLEDARKEIDELERPDIYALDRTQSEGAATYHADAGRIDAIADVFPFIFFLVAALVSLTTMTRMVEDERIQIGTYKALGYGTAAIAAKYLAYAGIAGVIGATVGIVTLSQVLPFIVMSAYSIIYTVPIHAFPLPINLPIALTSGGLGVGVTLLATWGAVVSSLREVPATLMLPRAPKAGKRILLERVRPVWSRLSFTWKVTFRNLFRYKRRFLMTVIGISGCTALLLVGFGLHDSIWDIIDRQYGPIIRFDTTIGLDDNAIETDVRRVCSYLSSTGEVSSIVRVQNENMQAGAAGTDETIRVNVVVPRDSEQMAEVITFRNRISAQPLRLDEDAVIVTEKLALKYGLSVGDQIILFDQDDVGNAVGDGHSLEVSGIAENYVGNYVYVGRSAWKQVDGSTPVFSTIYASTTPDTQVREGIAHELHDLECVSTVIFSDETIAMYRKMLSVVDMIVVVLIVSAAALAYIVLYNLTNINIGERIREIASLKVLGFTRGEVYTYIFREIALLALIGDALGMVLGIFLERFVVTTAEVDYVMFGRSIHPMSFVYAGVLTLVFTGLVVLSMRHKLDRVDMVESLKSVD